MEYRGLMGGFYRISEWIMRLSVINVLWIVFSVPFFFLMLTGLVNPEADVNFFRQWLVLLGIIAPFTLIPATAAVFSVARKWTTDEADVPLWRTFWRGYRENYKQAMLGGFLFLILGVVLYVNYRFYAGQGGLLGTLSLLFLLLMALLAAAFINFMSILVHFHMKTFTMIKNSLLVTFGQPINSIFLLVANGAILYFSLFKFTFLLVFFTGSLMAAVSFWTFHRSLTRLQDKMKSNEPPEDEDAPALEEEAPQSSDGDLQEDAQRK